MQQMAAHVRGHQLSCQFSQHLHGGGGAVAVAVAGWRGGGGEFIVIAGFLSSASGESLLAASPVLEKEEVLQLA